jgi:hypothetical protein
MLIKINWKQPVIITILIVFGIYFLHYWLSLLFEINIQDIYYTKYDWLVAYLFVFFSTIILGISIYIGIKGNPVYIPPKTIKQTNKKIKINFPLVILIFIFFFLWSLLMFYLNIGMTIYINFDPLPFKLVGILFYGRLFVQPFILSYLAQQNYKKYQIYIITIFLLILGSLASATSGSRFISFMFAFPFLILFKSKSKYLFFILILGVYITISTLSREFILPEKIEDIDISSTYGTDISKDETSQNISMIFFTYLITRVAGIQDVLTLFSFNNITGNILQSFQNLFAYFIPLIPDNPTLEFRNILGVDDGAIGGYSMGLFPNYWVTFGANIITYIFGLFFCGYLMGVVYRNYLILFHKISFNNAAFILFIFLFLLLFEIKANMFIYLYVLEKCLTYIFLKKLNFFK